MGTMNFYKNDCSIGGSMMNLPTKHLKKRKKAKVKVGDPVRCETEEFAFPFYGCVKKMLVNSAIVHIEHVMDDDRWLAKSKKNLAVVRFAAMEISKNDGEAS